MPFRPPRGLPKGPGSATYPQRHRDNMQTEGCTSKGTCPDFPAHGNGRHREAETPRRLLRTPHTPVTIERQVRHAGTGAAARPKAPRRLLRTPCAPRSLGGDLPLVNAVLLLPAVLHLGLERGNHLTGPGRGGAGMSSRAARARHRADSGIGAAQRTFRRSPSRPTPCRSRRARGRGGS